MLKKDITFTDFDGKTVTKTFWFHLSKAEITEMTLLFPGESLAHHLTTIAQAQNVPMLIAAFKDIIARSVGVRTDDGRFIKNQEISDEFMSSDAYSELFMSLIQNEGEAADFVNGIVPANLTSQAAPKEYTRQELLEMDDAQFEAIAGTDVRHMTKEHMQIAMQRRNQLV